MGIDYQWIWGFLLGWWNSFRLKVVMVIHMVNSISVLKIKNKTKLDSGDGGTALKGY